MSNSLFCSLGVVSFYLMLKKKTMRVPPGLEFIDLECHNSINSASGNANTARHVSVRRPTPPFCCPHLKIRGFEIAPICLLNQIQQSGMILPQRHEGINAGKHFDLKTYFQKQYSVYNVQHFLYRHLRIRQAQSEIWKCWCWWIAYFCSALHSKTCFASLIKNTWVSAAPVALFSQSLSAVYLFSSFQFAHLNLSWILDSSSYHF